MTLVPQGQHDAGGGDGDLCGGDQHGDARPDGQSGRSTLYTATIKGGAAGAKDLAGNPLAADMVWTFTTGASGRAVPERSHVDVDDQRLGPGREGPEQRGGGRHRWRDRSGSTG